MWSQCFITGLIILLIISFLYLCFYPRKRFEEYFCPCSTNLTKNIQENFNNKTSCSYPIPSMYQNNQNKNLLSPEQPYYKRSWPTCQPCGKNTDLNCQTQSYVEPYEEPYENFPRCTTSCQPSCDQPQEPCSQNPYGKHYEDPRWKNGIFVQPQEWNPELPGDSVGWYPTPNQLS